MSKIFKIITNRRYAACFRLIACTLIFTLIATFYGCSTTKIEKVDRDSIPSRNDYKLVSIVLKDSSYIDFNKGMAKFLPKYEDKTNVIMFSSQKSNLIIKLKDIAFAKIQIDDPDHSIGQYIFTGAIVLTGAALIGLIIYAMWSGGVSLGGVIF